MDTKEIHKMILKDGLRQFKFKNSKYQDTPSEEQRGSIFGYRNKRNMVNGRGIVLTSLEAVEDNQTVFTHWTPNVYRYGTYTQKNPRITQGHSENNLRQINTFYIDFDVKNQKESINYSDILVASLDLGFMPTLILKTENGYQAYFVLKDAAYVTASSNFKVINVAKMISQNIREHFNKELPVDMTCNHFGIARIPRKDNIEYFDKNNIYTFAEWFNWSMQQDDLEYPKKPNLFVLSGTEGLKQIDEPWYELLKKNFAIKGQKDLMGRNNVMFTLALACYSSGVSQFDCEGELLSFNETLSWPLSKSELNKTIRSAYSGKYEAASRDFIKILCQTWIDEKLTSKDLFIRQGWYKFKKSRSSRQRSHFFEWEDDLLNYIEINSEVDQPYIRITKKTIIEELDIPPRSLDHVLKELQRKKKILYKFKAGRNGGIIIALITAILRVALKQKNEEREALLMGLSVLLTISKEQLTEVIVEAIDARIEAYTGTLYELDTG